MSREPRLVECTICTAVAPDAVFTVRTYATAREPTSPISVQKQAAHNTNPQVNDLRCSAADDHGLSRVARMDRRTPAGLLVHEGSASGYRHTQWPG
jgi:hypothetical protein